MDTTKILDIIPRITGTYGSVINFHFRDMNKMNDHVTGTKFEEVVFENVSFENVEFQSTDFIKTKFIDCKFINCTFNFCKFKDCNLIACKIESCNFCITNSLNCNFLSCTYINNNWEASSTTGAFYYCNIEDQEMSNMEVTLTHEIPTLSSNLESCIA